MKMKVTTSIRPGLEHSLPNPYLSSLLLLLAYSHEEPNVRRRGKRRERQESRQNPFWLIDDVDRFIGSLIIGFVIYLEANDRPRADRPEPNK